MRTRTIKVCDGAIFVMHSRRWPEQPVILACDVGTPIELTVSQAWRLARALIAAGREAVGASED